MIPPYLALYNVTKSFTGHLAVDNVSFYVPVTSIFGLLGPNGAGKTTIIRMITQILMADSGKIEIQFEKLKPSHTKDIGYMPEERGLYKKMRVGDQLLYLARLRGLSKKDAKNKIGIWLEKFGLMKWERKKIAELSKGMQQKIQFIATVLHEPRLLILDEPFTGLDPINTNLIKDEIKRLRSGGTTVIFSTHRMEQVEQICDDIVLINNGKKILEGEVDVIKQRMKENKFRIGFDGEFPEDSSDLFETLETNKDHCIIHIMKGRSSNEVLQYLINKKLNIISFEEVLPTINEIFIRKVQGS